AMLRFDTLTTAVMDQFQSTYNGPAANMTAGVLTAGCLLLLGLEARFRGSERYARIGSGAARIQRWRHTAQSRIGYAIFLLSVTGLSLGVPIVTLARWLSIGGPAVWLHGNISVALVETLLFGLAGGILTTAAVAPMAWLSIRAPGRLSRLLEACHYYSG